MSNPQIKHSISGAVLYEGQAGMTTRQMLEKATATKADLRWADLRGADLRGADLRWADLQGAFLQGAFLRGAFLRGADLQGAFLRGANLQGAFLQGADLRGADGKSLRATDAESIEALDKVRAIILDDATRLEMDHWHGSNEWKDRTYAEEATCGTTHCLAGWLQVCSTKPEIRSMDAQLAGILSAPVAAKMFYKESADVLPWLEGRKYVEEIAAHPMDETP